jgi:penicillin-binding protein 2
MENKVGSIVALDPKTGGILALVSSPTFNPNLLTGAERK